MISENLVLELLNKIMEVNNKTEKAVFFDYSGHINNVSLRVCAGKKGEHVKDDDGFKIYDYNKELFEARISLERADEYYVKDIILKLDRFIDESN